MATHIKTRPITEADLLAYGEDVRVEVINGEIRVGMSPNRIDHSFFVARITSYLDAFVSSRNLGRVFGDMATFNIEIGLQQGIIKSLAPDAAYVSFERLPADANIHMMPNLAPDIVVEVISDSESFSDVLEKTRMGLNGGVKMVLLIIPGVREVHVHTPGIRAGIILTEADNLTGGDAQPGFEIPVKAIFDDANTALHVDILRRLLGSQ